jgi:hypothetical protein
MSPVKWENKGNSLSKKYQPAGESPIGSIRESMIGSSSVFIITGKKKGRMSDPSRSTSTQIHRYTHTAQPPNTHKQVGGSIFSEKTAENRRKYISTSEWNELCVSFNQSKVG